MANAKGVDVSKWQTLSEWSTDGLSFVIVKASEGLTADPMYAKHVAKGRAAGLVVGAYHFNRDDVDIVKQAKFFADASRDADLWFIDVEGNYAFSRAETELFIDTFVEYTGKHIGLYHSASGFFEAGQDYDWVAHWGVTSPGIAWDFHQYRGAPLDLDQFNGTEDDLRAFVRRLNNTMPTIVTYLPGQVATVGSGANIRADATLGGALLRTTTRAEKWTIVGWVAGDSYEGNNRWLCRWASNRWEYTHAVNVTVQPAPVPPTATDCEVYSKQAYAIGLVDGRLERQPEVDALTAKVTNLESGLQACAETSEALSAENSALKDKVASLDNSLLDANERVENLELTVDQLQGTIDSAGDILSSDPAVEALRVLRGEV